MKQFFGSGLTGLLALVAAPFTRAHEALVSQNVIGVPKDCRFVGYLQAHKKHARLVVTSDEEEAVKSRRTGQPVCVWRKTWPDNGRKSKRYARATVTG